MEAVIAAVVSAVVSLGVALITYRQSRRDSEAKERQLAESVTSELIRQRIAPYTEFMKGLTCASSQHDLVPGLGVDALQKLLDLIQGAIYGPIGLLATHETRQLILHVRAGCYLYQQKAVDHYSFMLRVWALHLSLRSDLGIQQPEWESAVEKVRRSTNSDFTRWEDLVKAYPWERLLVHSKDKLPAEAR